MSKKNKIWALYICLNEACPRKRMIRECKGALYYVNLLKTIYPEKAQQWNKVEKTLKKYMKIVREIRSLIEEVGKILEEEQEKERKYRRGGIHSCENS